VVKEQGGANDLLERLAADPAFSKVDLATVMEPSQYVGRSPQQVDEFVTEVVEPIRAKYAGQGGEAEIHV